MKLKNSINPKIFQVGGSLRDKALNRSNYTASNYEKAKDFNMNPYIYKLRRWLKDIIGKGGLSNCTLSATQWIDPTNFYMSAKNVMDSDKYIEISKDNTVPGDLLISKNPKTGTYHTMMIEGFDKNQNPLLRYSKGGHDTKENLVIHKPLIQYHQADIKQGGNHTEDHYFRYKYPDEVTLPAAEIVVNRNK